MNFWEFEDFGVEFKPDELPFEDKVDGYYEGAVLPDELFDALWHEPSVPVDTRAMSDWDNAHQRFVRNQIVRLTPDEEKQLTEEVKAGSLDARDEMIQGKLGHAAWLVRHSMDFHKRQRETGDAEPIKGKIVGFLHELSGIKFDYDNRMQIASEALVKAVDSFDARARFGVYLQWRFESALLRARHTDPSGTNPHTSADIDDITRIEREFDDEYGYQPTIFEIADEIENRRPANSLSPFVVAERMIIRNALQAVSWEQLQEYFAPKPEGPDEWDEEEVFSPSDLLVDPYSEMTVEEQVVADSLGYFLDIALDHLSDRERLLIEMRMGMEPFGGTPMTRAEVGHEFGLTQRAYFPNRR